MKIALTDVEQLTGSWHVLRGIFEQLVASISLVMSQEHHSDGTHSTVTAESVTTTALAISAPWLVRRAAVITPTQITANQNNYNPPNLTAATILRLSSDAARNITGLLAPSNVTDETRKLLRNVGGFNLVLTDADAASTAANRFANPGAASVTLNAGDAIWISYDPQTARWRPEGL